MLNEKVYIYVYNFKDEITKIGFNSLEELDDYTMDCRDEQDLKDKLINDGYLKSNILYTEFSVMDKGLLKGRKELRIRFSKDLFNIESLFNGCVEFFTSNYSLISKSPLKREYSKVQITGDVKEKDILQGIRKYFSRNLNYRDKRELYFYLEEHGVVIDLLDSFSLLEDKHLDSNEDKHLDKEDGDEIDSNERENIDIESDEEIDYLEYLDSRINNPHTDQADRDRLIEELSKYDIEELQKKDLTYQVDGVKGEHHKELKNSVDVSYLEYLANIFNDPNSTDKEREWALSELIESNNDVNIGNRRGR